MRPLVLASALALAPITARADDWFGRDKALHFGASAALASGGYGVASLGLSRPGRFGVGAGVALGAGVAKELWDLSGRGDPSWKDMAWNALGTGTGLALAFAVDLLLASPRPAPAR